MVCINERDYELSLVRGKVYQVVRPEKNDRPADYRVIDEEGEDYLYDAGRFVPIDLPPQGKKVIMARDNTPASRAR